MNGDVKTVGSTPPAWAANIALGVVPRMSVGGLVAEILAANETAKIVSITYDSDGIAHVIVADPSDAEVTATKKVTLTPDDTTKKSSSWTGVAAGNPSAEATTAQTVVAPANPVLSVASLVDRIEAAVKNNNPVNLVPLTIVVDQEAGSVVVMSNQENTDGGVTLIAEVEFTVEPIAAASAAPRLAFE